MSAARTGLTEGSIVSSLLRLAVPIILANLLQAGYQLTDAFWVGRLGGAAVASVAICFPLTFFLISAGAGLAIAGSTLVAQYTGAGNRQMVNRVAAQTLLIVVLVSLVLAPAGMLLAPQIIRWMGVSPDVYVGAVSFFRMTCLGLPFVFSFVMFQSVMRGIGEVRLPLAIVFGTVLLNFGLDPLFIFGWGPLKGSGVTGAAMATVATQSLSAAIGMVTLFWGRDDIHLRAADFSPDWQLLRKSFWLGLPASIEQSARSMGLLAMTTLIARFGTVAVAAFGVGANILQFVIIPSMGLAMATATLVGQNIGAGNLGRAERVAVMSGTVAFVGLTGVGLIFFLLAPGFVGLFIPGDPAVIESGGDLVRSMSLAFGLIGLQMALSGVFRGAGDMKAPLALALVSQWLLQLPVGYALSLHTRLGVRGIWLAFPISNVVVAALAITWYRTGRWKRVNLTADDRLAKAVSQEILIEEGANAP